MCQFSRKSSFFEAAYNTKINILLISCQLDAWIPALASKLAVNCVSDLLEGLLVVMAVTDRELW